MLEVEGIDVYYGPIQALRSVTLHVGEGEMVALLGANGAGKTTTLRAISGMLAPRTGTIRIGGKVTSRMSAHKLVRLGVAHLPEGRELFPELTVVENLRLGHWSRRSEKRLEREHMDEVMDLLPRLRERAEQAAGTLSGGEQQMLGVARALMSQPKLLLVDELSLGLAPIIVQQLFDALRQVNKTGTSILLVEQFVQTALRNTSRAYVLARGEVVVEGASERLLTSPELMAAYLGETADSGEQEPSPAPKRRAPSRKK